jgi:cation transport ATPase
MKVQVTKDKEDIKRIAIVALLVALNFGILNYFGSTTTFNVIDFSLILSVIAKAFVGSTLLIFLLYIVILGIFYLYKPIKIKQAHHFLYQFGMALTVLIIFFTLMMTLGIKMASYFDNNTIIIYLFLGLGFFIGLVLFYKIMKPFWKSFNDIIYNLLKKFINLFIDP